MVTRLLEHCWSPPARMACTPFPHAGVTRQQPATGVVHTQAALSSDHHNHGPAAAAVPCQRAASTWHGCLRWRLDACCATRRSHCECWAAPLTRPLAEAALLCLPWWRRASPMFSVRLHRDAAAVLLRHYVRLTRCATCVCPCVGGSVCYRPSATCLKAAGYSTASVAQSYDERANHHRDSQGGDDAGPVR